MKRRWAVIVILLLALCGIADAAYIQQHEASGSPLICNIQGLSGCNVVSASPYSHVFGISLAAYGVLYYGIIFVLAALELAIADQLLRRVLQALTAFGILVSLYSVVLQTSVIHALCEYCIASALIILVMFILASLIEPIKRSNRTLDTHSPETVIPTTAPPTTP